MGSHIESLYHIETMDLKTLLVLAAVAISYGQALKCHQCSSLDDPKCGDPFVDEGGAVVTDEFLKECPTDKEYTMCRKIYQYIRDEESIIRTCGYEEYKYDCYKTVLEEYSTWVCSCKEDGCNG